LGTLEDTIVAGIDFLQLVTLLSCSFASQPERAIHVVRDKDKALLYTPETVSAAGWLDCGWRQPDRVLFSVDGPWLEG